MGDMYRGVWLDGFKKLTQPFDWLLLSILLGVALFIGIRAAYFLENPLRFVTINRWVILVVLVVIFGGVSSQMNAGALKQPGVTPNGTISFELAKDGRVVGDMLEKWREGTIHAAIYQTRLDFLFILAYVAVLSFACFWIAEKTNGILSLAALTIGWAVPIAGLFDVVENIALLRMLDSGAADLPAKIAYWMALPKFVIILYFAVPFVLLSAVFLASGIPSRLRR